MTGARALLHTQRLESFYGDFQALFGVDIQVDAGEVVALIGANGAGKTTFLKTVCGLMKPRRGAIVFDGESIEGLPPGQIVQRGLAMVPEGRRLFATLSVEENLLMGRCARREGVWHLGAVYRLFPILDTRRHHLGDQLSGGEQQLVAIGRALMTNPRLLLCDEISLGLAPVMVQRIYDALPEICAGGLTVVIVEQDVGVAQRVSQRLYCLQEGHVRLMGGSNDLTREQISRAYFGR